MTSELKPYFETFHDISLFTEAAQSAPGVGLGLALSRRLARQLGGDLCYEPAQGRGASFCLSLVMA